MPVFIDTLADHATTKRFGERYGSYPVIRVHDLEGRDLSRRLDGNPVAGRIPVEELEAEMEAGLRAFERGN